LIEVTELSFAYGRKPVLRSLTFAVREGEKVVLLGVNGSGKSTLLKILDGLLFGWSGSYKFHRTEITREKLRNSQFRKSFRKQMALQFQNPDAMLFNPTVFDEIAYGPRQIGRKDYRDIVHYWMDFFGLEDKADTLPFKLSAGEKKKLSLASVLAVEPEVLLLDEPLASLDPRSMAQIVELLQDLNKTIITATHNLSLAQELGNRFLLLSEDHELLFDGTWNALIKDEELLLRANLIHLHKHVHGSITHTHPHSHLFE